MINTYKIKSNIIYNGTNLNQMYDLYVVDESTEMESGLGVVQSAKINNGALVGVEKENFTFNLKFIRKIDGEPASLDGIYYGRTFLEEINRVFYNTSQGGVNILEIGGRIYYVIPIGGSLVRHSRNVGEFTISFESLSPYCYSPIQITPYRINKTNSPKTVDIINNGNTINYAELCVECVQAGKLTVNNNNAELVINANVGDIITIDGDTAEVSDYSKVVGNIKDTLMLRYGENNLVISTTGDFKVEFSNQSEYALC